MKKNFRIKQKNCGFKGWKNNVDKEWKENGKETKGFRVISIKIFTEFKKEQRNKEWKGFIFRMSE